MACASRLRRLLDRSMLTEVRKEFRVSQVSRLIVKMKRPHPQFTTSFNLVVVDKEGKRRVFARFIGLSSIDVAMWVRQCLVEIIGADAEAGD